MLVDKTMPTSRFSDITKYKILELLWLKTLFLLVEITQAW